MKISLTFLIILVSVYILFLLYEQYKNRRKYKIVKKFSINNGEDIECYFTIRQTNNKNEFTVKVNEETYKLYDLDDYIIIL